MFTVIKNPFILSKSFKLYNFKDLIETINKRYYQKKAIPSFYLSSKSLFVKHSFKIS